MIRYDDLLLTLHPNTRQPPIEPSSILVVGMAG